MITWFSICRPEDTIFSYKHQHINLYFNLLKILLLMLPTSKQIQKLWMLPSGKRESKLSSHNNNYQSWSLQFLSQKNKSCLLSPDTISPLVPFMWNSHSRAWRVWIIVLQDLLRLPTLYFGMAGGFSITE